MITPTKGLNLDEKHYEELIAKEAKHWGVVASDPQNPQLWDDNRLFELFFGREYRHMVERVGATGPRVLELGCGEGTLAIDLARRGLQVAGFQVERQPGYGQKRHMSRGHLPVTEGNGT
mgnify:CR=1 FL=1